MKNLIHIALVLFMATTFVSCEKEAVSIDQSLNSMAGITHTGVVVEFYEITPDDKGDCVGVYFTPTEENLGHLLRVTGGVPNLSSLIEEVGGKPCTIDFEYTGRNYYCNQPYNKTDSDGSSNNYPYEIQEVKILNMYPDF